MSAIPVNFEVSLRQAIAELERRCGLGETQVCESILADFPHLRDRRDSVLELIYFEYVLSQDRDQPISDDELKNRFPEFDSDLQKILNVDRAFRNPMDTDGKSASTEKSVHSTLGIESGSPIAAQHGEFDGFGDYELLEILGQGGMGVVYKARQRRLNRFVAVKTIDTLSSMNPAAVSRFRTEAELVAKLQHPNIVQVYEVGSQHAVPFFSMELVTGGTLGQATSDRPLIPATAARIVETLARAVHYAHSQSIVHRDLKPSNILLSPSERSDAIEMPMDLNRAKTEGLTISNRMEPKIADFGLAKYLEGALERTASQAMIGTPSYMAPELIDSELGHVGPGCDVYSLGAILYDMLTGKPPFNAATVIETIQQVRNSDVISPSKLQSKIPRDLETICLKCLRKEPSKRYVSAIELANDLHRFLDGQPIRARPAGMLEHGWKWSKRHPSMAGLVAAVLIASISITLLWLRSEQSRFAARTALKHNDQLLYGRDIAIAQFEYQSNRVARSREILDRTNPEHRGWEWSYLYNQANTTIWESPKQMAPIVQVDISPDGRFVATASSKSKDVDSQAVHVWNIVDNELKWKFQGDADCSFHDVRFSPDGALLLTSARAVARGAKSGVNLWDLSTGTLRRNVSPASTKVSRFSRDGKCILVGDAVGTVTQYSAETGEVIRKYAAGRSTIMDLDFNPDGSQMVVATLSNGVSLWDTLSGKKLQSFADRNIHSISWAPDGKSLSVSSVSGLSRLYRFEAGAFALLEQKQYKQLRFGRFTPDGRRMVSAESGGSIDIQDAITGGLNLSIPAHNGQTMSLSFDSSGRYMVTGGRDNRVCVWDLAAMDHRMVQSPNKGARANSIVLSPSNTEMAIALSSHSTRKPRIEVRNVATHQLERELLGHTDWATCVAYTPDGKYLVSGSLDQTVRVWDSMSGEQLTILEGHESPLSGVSFLADTRFAVSVDKSGRTIVWNIENKSMERVWSLNSTVQSISFHPLRPLFAVACEGLSVAIWDALTGEKRAELSMPADQVCFSPNGRRLATVGAKQPTLIWQTDSLLRGTTARPTCELLGQSETISDVSFSPNGKRLVCSCRDESVRLFDVECGYELISLESRRGTDGKVQFSSDGKSIVYVIEGAINTWSVDEVHLGKSLRSSKLSDKEWHRAEAVDAAKSHNSFAVQFHQGRLTQLEANKP